ncbi:uncharacterized protein LOC123193496 [Mangifera indica]|uniref:uncharacterized protein LOC123193496 n=1 Tax=Mangifera indica TaxID=29780 RepID=UPI001CFB1F46|nr:uncharacterized protein LOC123193496 [Mangifera indica]
MALSSAFRERLEQMEHTRNQRISLLQLEKQVQANKSQVLASKLASVRLTEQRCLLLDRKIASQNFKILSLKSEIDISDAKYVDSVERLRVLKNQVEEMETMEKEKEKYYELKETEMKEFRKNVENFVEEYRLQVEDLRNKINKLNFTFKELQGNNGHLSNSAIAAAEVRNSELLALKENIKRNLASNYQVRTQLQKQLQNVLIAHNQEMRGPS